MGFRRAFGSPKPSAQDFMTRQQSLEYQDLLASSRLLEEFRTEFGIDRDRKIYVHPTSIFKRSKDLYNALNLLRWLLCQEKTAIIAFPVGRFRKPKRFALMVEGQTIDDSQADIGFEACLSTGTVFELPKQLDQWNLRPFIEDFVMHGRPSTTERLNIIRSIVKQSASWPRDSDYHDKATDFLTSYVAFTSAESIYARCREAKDPMERRSSRTEGLRDSIWKYLTMSSSCLAACFDAIDYEDCLYDGCAYFLTEDQYGYIKPFMPGLRRRHFFNDSSWACRFQDVIAHHLLSVDTAFENLSAVQVAVNEIRTQLTQKQQQGFSLILQCLADTAFKSYNDLTQFYGRFYDYIEHHIACVGKAIKMQSSPKLDDIPTLNHDGTISMTTTQTASLHARFRQSTSLSSSQSAAEQILEDTWKKDGWADAASWCIELIARPGFSSVMFSGLAAESTWERRILQARIDIITVRSKACFNIWENIDQTFPNSDRSPKGELQDASLPPRSEAMLRSLRSYFNERHCLKTRPQIHLEAVAFALYRLARSSNWGASTKMHAELGFRLDKSLRKVFRRFGHMIVTGDEMLCAGCSDFLEVAQDASEKRCFKSTKICVPGNSKGHQLMSLPPFTLAADAEEMIKAAESSLAILISRTINELQEI